MQQDSQKCWRLGVVSYLNAKPLIPGLESDPQCELIFDVPSRLPKLLDQNEVDAALVPVIDLFYSAHDWQVISDACIGCDGETFTVRVFSHAPAEALTRLCVDGDSHTSVCLAKVLWQEHFGCKLETVPYEPGKPVSRETGVLLIGDKVVTAKPTEFEYEIDLGSSWKSLTSLPFVFAAWVAARDSNCEVLADKLNLARDAGVKSAELIAADYGPGMGWPVHLATRYLTKRIKYTIGPRQKEAMQLFHEMIKRHEIIPDNQTLVFA